MAQQRLETVFTAANRTGGQWIDLPFVLRCYAPNHVQFGEDNGIPANFALSFP